MNYLSHFFSLVNFQVDLTVLTESVGQDLVRLIEGEDDLNFIQITKGLKWSHLKFPQFWYPSQSLPSWFGYTPGSTNIAGWKTGPDWRCISYWKWGYSIAMLVYQRVYVFTIRTHFCLLFFVGWWNMKGWHYFSDGLEPVCRGLSLHRMKGCCLIFQKGYYLFHPVTSSKVKVQFIGIP